MAQALDWEDPASALRKLSISSGKKAETLALELETTRIFSHHVQRHVDCQYR